LAHVARHGRPLPATGPATATRRLALQVALNVVRELDTLLGHAVAEVAAITGVVLRTPDDGPARTALVELRGLLAPLADAGPDLARADRLRAGLARAVAGRRALERHRPDGIYPHGVVAGYRRVAGELAGFAGPVAPEGASASITLPVAGSVRGPVRGPVRGDDAVTPPG